MKKKIIIILLLLISIFFGYKYHQNKNKKNNTSDYVEFNLENLSDDKDKENKSNNDNTVKEKNNNEDNLSKDLDERDESDNKENPDFIIDETSEVNNLKIDEIKLDIDQDLSNENDIENIENLSKEQLLKLKQSKSGNKKNKGQSLKESSEGIYELKSEDDPFKDLIKKSEAELKEKENDLDKINN